MPDEIAMLTFQTKKFLTNFWPKPEDLLAFVVPYGVTNLKPQAVYKWYVRESVPSDWFPILLVFIELDRGAPPSLAEYLK
jgi:hypothetical protein